MNEGNDIGEWVERIKNQLNRLELDVPTRDIYTMIYSGSTHLDVIKNMKVEKYSLYDVVEFNLEFRYLDGVPHLHNYNVSLEREHCGGRQYVVQNFFILDQETSAKEAHKSLCDLFELKYPGIMAKRERKPGNKRRGRGK